MREWRDEVRKAIAALNLEPTRESEIVDELSQHLRDREEEMLISGMSAEQIGRVLIEELHDSALARGLEAVTYTDTRRESVQVQDGEGMLTRCSMDLRYGARSLLQSPGFAVVVIASLALGIGANTAIFELLNAVRLRALPVKHPEELAAVRIADSPHCCRGDFYSDHADLTGGIWTRVHDEQQGFLDIAAWYPKRQNLGHGGEAQHVETLLVSGNFFGVLGVRPSLGRLISPPDDHRGCGAQNAVVSYAFWNGNLGGGRDVLGRVVTLDGHPFQIAGVTPPNFYGVEVGRSFDVAIPLCSEAIFSTHGSLMDSPASWFITTIGRLKPGWNLERASAQLAAISPRIFAATVPDAFDGPARKDYLSLRLRAVAAATGFSKLRDHYQRPLWVLLALSGLVLLIASANVANLMLARAGARRREMALRLSLGASRPRLISQLLAESVLLAMFGATAGAGLAAVFSNGLIAFLSTQEDRVYLELTPDRHVLAFVTGVACLACILFGLTPAWRASRTDPAMVLKTSGHGVTASGEGFLIRRMLVISQVALSLVLVVGALLFVRTFQNLMTVDVGFREDHVLIAEFDYSSLKLPKDHEMAFKRELLSRIQSIPVVTSAAEALITPLGHIGWDNNVDIPNGPHRQHVLFNRVSPGYFQTLQIPLITGRDFNPGDTPRAPRKAIINQTFARMFFGHTRPLGKIFWHTGQPDETYEVVGVARDSKYYSLREDARPTVFVSFTQATGPEQHSTLVVRSSEEFPPLTSSIKSASSELNPGIALNFGSLKTQIRDGLLRERLMATLSGFFGGLATLLAVVGLYGVISYLALMKRSEIGLRMALGAERIDILMMVLREAALLVGLGVLIGAALELAAGRVAASLLFGLKPTDPVTLGLGVAAMAAVALGASFFPARRASTLDPMIVLRDQ